MSPAALPLSTLLSQVLVAFTIEFDNEFEHHMPHRTTSHGSTPGSRHAPWLVSMAMWSNCMQFVGPQGVPVGELEDLARTTTNLNGMQRWGYIVVEPDSAGGRPKASRSNWLIRATPQGRQAQEIWRPLFANIEQRWQARFGNHQIHPLRESLRTLIGQMQVDLPDCLPILGYGLFSRGPRPKRREPPVPQDGIGASLPLPALLSKVLLAFAIEFERESDLSLAIGANLLRVLDQKGVRVRDLPRLSGVSPEAIAMALGVLQKRNAAVVGPDQTAGRAPVVRLTAKGQEAQAAYHQLLGIIEECWQARYGKDAVCALRELLGQLACAPAAQLPPLFRGLDPYPDGWRASVRTPGTLPHYPMVLHRGGFPDGS